MHNMRANITNVTRKNLKIRHNKAHRVRFSFSRAPRFFLLGFFSAVALARSVTLSSLRAEGTRRSPVLYESVSLCPTFSRRQRSSSACACSISRSRSCAPGIGGRSSRSGDCSGSYGASLTCNVTRSSLTPSLRCVLKIYLTLFGWIIRCNNKERIYISHFPCSPSCKIDSSACLDMVPEHAPWRPVPRECYCQWRPETSLSRSVGPIRTSGCAPPPLRNTHEEKLFQKTTPLPEYIHQSNSYPAFNIRSSLPEHVETGSCGATIQLVFYCGGCYWSWNQWLLHPTPHLQARNLMIALEKSNDWFVTFAPPPPGNKVASQQLIESGSAGLQEDSWGLTCAQRTEALNFVCPSVFRAWRFLFGGVWRWTQ